MCIRDSIAVERRGDRTAGDSAERKPATGTGIAEIEYAGGLGKTADADAIDPPFPLAGSLDAGAEGLQGFRGVEHVFAFEQPADPGLADRQRAENERPDRDRLVARHADAAGQGAVAARCV